MKANSVAPDGVRPNREPSLRVCHVIGSIGHGGRESLLEDIISQSPDDIEYSLCGMRVRDGHADRFDRLGVETVSFEARSARDVRAIGRMAHFFFTRPIDVIHAHGPNAQIPCRMLSPLCGGSVVSTVHGVPEMFPERTLRLERITRPLETRTVAVSNGVRNAFVGSSEDHQWKTIQNGIDVESFHHAVQHADPSAVRDEYAVSDTDFIFLNIGRYVPPKAQLDLIDAMDYVVADRRDLHLFIVGGRGAMEPRLRDRVAEHDLTDHVTVTGGVDDIHAYFALADAFVSSSVGEGLPIVQLESMAAKLPVIATDIPGVRELVVDGKTGILVPPRSPQSLGNAMIELIESDDRERFGRAGHARVREEFHIRNTVEEYISLYRELAGSGGG